MERQPVVEVAGLRTLFMLLSSTFQPVYSVVSQVWFMGWPSSMAALDTAHAA